MPALFKTHDVVNQPYALEDYDLFTGDAALVEAVDREGASFARDLLEAYGKTLGAAKVIELGALANRHPPEFDTHDRYGRRVDLVRFHPSYHELMRLAIESGIHSSPWTDPGSGAHVARAARFYMQSQIEAGHGCPITMTFASTPTLKLEPSVASEWLPKIHARVYDPRNLRAAEKAGLTIGMAMTEKQGGSDLRLNSTQATPAGDGMYEIVGHKFFVSAPMCDAFLTLAQTPQGLTCFFAPRWLPDGSKNGIEFIRLKRKMGNVSNASSETEWRGALAWRVGPEGRGVATIIEMVAMTRFDCMLGSSAGMRRAVAEAIDHCRQRAAFGARLWDQPIMRDVLADLAVESEAALLLTMRDCARPRQSRRPAVRIDLCALARRWANTGSASERRCSPTKLWNASAARARWRMGRCRGSIARRQSTRSGRAAATSNASMSCAPFRRRRMRSTLILTSSTRRAAPTALLTRTSTSSRTT